MGSVNEYKCLNCKASMRFDPPSQKWKCDYCFSEFTKEQLDEVYTEEGIEKKQLERERHKQEKTNQQLERILVMMGIINNDRMKADIDKKLAAFHIDEADDGDNKADDQPSESENESQIMTFIVQAMANKDRIEFNVINENRKLESLTRRYSDMDSLNKEIEGISLIEAEYDNGKVELSREYFSPMGIVYLLQQGNLRAINFLKVSDTAKASTSQEDIENEKDLDIYHCTSCGADLIADETTSATFCVYCKSPAIIKDRFKGRFKPRWVIPFRLTKENAEELYSDWIKKKLFAPKEFKNREEVEKITGIYAPFWLFDCNAVGSINGRGTKVHRYRRGQYEYTNTKYYSVARAGSSSYEKIPVDSSKKLDDQLMNMIEPYNYDDITDFSMQYMTGFMAEKYDVEVEEAKAVLADRTEAFIESRLEDTVNHYSTYHTTNRNIDLLGIEDNYALMPIYLLVNKYNGKEHKFIVNGQTGKVVGETPISFMEQLKFGLILFSVLLILGMFGGALIG